MAEPILEIQDLTVRFPVFGGVFLRRQGEVRAVDGVSLTLNRGETLGVVGESGCGKSTVGRAIVNILKAMSYRVEVSGKILYHHPSGVVDLAALDRSGMRQYRSDIQMVFQDPYSSLNPRKTVDQIVEEPLRVHTPMSKAERMDRVRWLLEAQVINLMQDLQQEFGLSYIFIAHDLSVVRHISDRIAVMYLGHVVEMGEGDQIYSQPVHPYSRALLASAPVPDPFIERKQPVRLTGDVPSPMNKPSGCAFRTRCPIAQPSCADAVPPLEMKAGRLVACPVVDGPTSS